MASSGNDPDEREVASSATAATDEVDSAWGSEAPAAQASKADEEPGESPGDVKAEPPAELPVEVKIEPPVEPPLEVKVEPPAEPPRVEAPPAEARAEPPPLEPPPVAASPFEARDDAGPVAAFWSARPSGAWLAVGGGAIVLAFVVGILTGRGSRPEPEVAQPVPSASQPAPSAVIAATAPAPTPTPASPPAESAEAPSASSNASQTSPKHAQAGFNAKAAKLAIDKIVPGLKSCKQPGEPPGTATVTVTFAPTGRVSDARVTTTRYAGTRTGNCIAQRLRQARIPEFVGTPQTVKRSISIR